jgi:hypothetical protein
LHCSFGLANGVFGIKLKPVGPNTKRKNNNSLLLSKIATNKMAYNFTELNNVVANWAIDKTTRYNFHEPASEFKFVDNQPNNIVMMTKGTEMIKVAEDGFYVRGVKVPTDAKEAAIVYKAFKEFLVWSRLNRD